MAVILLTKAIMGTQATPTRTRLCIALLIGVLPLAGAQAQSGYAMTRLAQPSGQKLPVTGRVVLDQQNRAYTTYDFKRMGFDFSVPPFPQWMELSMESPVQWAASTAASITPTRLNSNSLYVQSVTPSGGRLFESCSRYWDRKSYRVVSLPLPEVVKAMSTIASCNTLAGNDAGALVQTYGYRAVDDSGNPVYDENAVVSVALARTAKGVSRLLPKPMGLKNAAVMAINAKGVMAGRALNKTRYDLSSRAVIWAANDQPTVLPEPVSNEGSEATHINDNGDVVVASGTPLLNPGSSTQTSRAGTTYHVWRAGAYQAIQPLPGYDVVAVTGLNNQGVVVGILALQGGYQLDLLERYGASYIESANIRTFIWRDGITKDLTEEVRNKGVTLAAGARLTRVSSINDKGSLAASLFDPAQNPQYVTVRLTAKP